MARLGTLASIPPRDRESPRRHDAGDAIDRDLRAVRDAAGGLESAGYSA